jgi:redox-sensitive bicupin YhaK (pirin superfamily)
VQVGEREIRERFMAVLANDGEGVRLTADAPARLILVAGKPLSEPIVQYGPFVMNSQSEIEQALQDYQAGRFSQALVARQP